MNDQALETLSKALANPLPDAIVKAFTSPTSATSGLAQYDLEEGAKLIFPIDTPLLKQIPRVVGGTGIQANWRSILAVNQSGMAIGLSEGNRGGYNSYTEVDTFAKFVELGLDDYVTWKAERAAQGFDNLDELAVKMLLWALKEAEERTVLGGNAITGFGTTPNPTVATSTTGGTLPSQSGLLTCVALTMKGVQLSSVANGVAVPYTRTNADGTTDNITGFTAQPSSSVAATTSTSTSSLTATVAVVPGAFGYAWFYGTSGNQLLAAITSINSLALTAPSAGTQNLTALPATDSSKDPLVYDGLSAQITNSALTYGAAFGSYLASQPTGVAGTGTKLTSGGAGTGSIVEFDTAINAFFNNHRLVPTDIWINGHDQTNIKSLILNGNTNLQPFFTGNEGEVRAGAVVKTYLNPIGYGNQQINLNVHPFLPQGTVLFTTKEVPYPLSNVRSIWRINLRRDYYSILWPLRSRKYEYGVYLDGVLQHYFPAAMGMIQNIAP